MVKKDNMRIIRRLFLSLVPIQALAVGLPAINTLLSSFLIGNFMGENALAAIGFAGPLLWCIEAVSKTLSGGAQVIAGKAIGRGDRSALNCVFNTSMILSLMFGFLTTSVCLTLPETLAVFQGTTGKNIGVTAEFIRGIGVGMGFSAMSACLFIFLQLERMDKVSGFLSIVMLAVNVGGNAVNIFWLRLGMFGSGLFLSLSNIIVLLIGLPILLTKGKIFKFSPNDFRIKEALEILRLGSPNAIMSLTNVVRNPVMNYYIFKLGGNTAMSALAVASNISTAIGSVVQSGYAGSCKIISGMLIGQRDVSSLRKLPKTMIKSVGYLYLLAYALVFVLAKPFALMMGADVGNLAIYVLVIRMYNLWYFTNLIVQPARAIYEVLGRVWFIGILNILCNAVFPSALCSLFSMRLGLWFTVSMPFLDEIPLIILLIAEFRRKAHRMPKFPFELCDVPSSISVPREDRFNRTIATIEDAVTVSKEAIEFCRNKGLNSKTANTCGLCIEEIAVDTVLNRFRGKKSTIDLRMIFEDGHIRILLRDDCEHFDPKEWLSLCSPKDESRSIGIRMASKMALKMEYVNTLGLNELTVLI